MKLIWRLAIPVGLLNLLLASVAVGAAWYVHALQRSSTQIYENNLRSIRAAEELEIAVREIRRMWVQFLLAGENTSYPQMLELQRNAEHWLNEARSLAVEVHEHDLITRAENGYARYLEQLDALNVAAGRVPTLDQVRKLSDGLQLEIIEPAHAYLDFNEQVAARTSQSIAVMADRMVIALLVLGFAGASAGMLLGWSSSRWISRSIGQLSVPIQDAAGRLNQVVGPITLSSPMNLHELESVLQHIAREVGAVIEQMQQAQRDALRAEQLAAVGQLAAGLAHELRNPLTAMKMLTLSTAEELSAEGRSVPDLEVVLDEVTRLERMTQLFLDFARPPRSEWQTTDVRRIVEQAIHVLSSRAGFQNVRLECDLCPEELRAELDARQIHQVLLNLVGNALDVLPNGGRITILLRRYSAEFELIVTDNGPGLPETIRDRLFEPFVTTRETGVGLGLSICRRIVEDHHGRISAEQGPEGGALFRIRCPIHQTQTNSASGPVSSVEV